MDTEPAGIDNPVVAALEDRLALNYDEFQALALEHSRAWQKELVRRRVQRHRAQAQQSGTPHEQDAA